MIGLRCRIPKLIGAEIASEPRKPAMPQPALSTALVISASDGRSRSASSCALSVGVMRPAWRWKRAAPTAISNSAIRLLTTDLERLERAAAPETVPVSITSRKVLISSIVHLIWRLLPKPDEKQPCMRSQIANAAFPDRLLTLPAEIDQAVNVSNARVFQMQLTGIHHLTAITADVAANKRFYTELLGLRLVKKTVNQ